MPLSTETLFSSYRLVVSSYVSMAVLAGGNVRVGLEDNLYLSRGVKATNGQLVERARTILEAMNVKIMGPEDVRKKLKLTKHA